MGKRGRKTSAIWRAVFAAGVAMLIGLTANPVMSAEGVNPEADEILRSMSVYLAGLPAFSVTGDVDNEIIDQDGQKLQWSSFATLIVERPGKLYLTRKGAFADVTLIFDGKTLTLHSKKPNVYAQLESPGTIDDAIRNLESETGLDLPGADLLFSDPYAILASGVLSSAYLGVGYVNGIECHHLAFRKAKVDWQLWVQVGDAPLPMKYIITTKWMTGAPQYALRLRDWNTKPQIEANRFTFSAPEGARRLETIPVSETGEIMIEEGQQ